MGVLGCNNEIAGHGDFRSGTHHCTVDERDNGYRALLDRPISAECRPPPPHDPIDIPVLALGEIGARAETWSVTIDQHYPAAIARLFQRLEYRQEILAHLHVEGIA